MPGDGGVDEDGLGVGALEHGRFGGEEEIGGEVGAVDVVLAEGGVGFGVMPTVIAEVIADLGFEGDFVVEGHGIKKPSNKKP